MNPLRTTKGAIFTFAITSPLFAHHDVEHEASTPALIDKLQSFIDDTAGAG